MTKYLTTTAITIDGADAQTFTDTATYTGGSTAASQIKQRHDVNVKSADGTTEIYIPFHAIVKANFTRTTTTADDPVDAFCGTEESSDGGAEEGPGGGTNRI